jgi:hypothetical protein
MHAYAYSNNNPASFSDPDGLRYDDGGGGASSPPKRPTTTIGPAEFSLFKLVVAIKDAVKRVAYLKVPLPNGQPAFDFGAFDVANNLGQGLQQVKNQANNFNIRGNGLYNRTAAFSIQTSFRKNNSLNALERLTQGRYMTRVGGAMAIADGVFTYTEELERGAPPAEALAVASAGTAGGYAGAILGAKAGAFIGTLIAPGPGTIIGAGVGAVIGGIAGSEVGKSLVRGFCSLFG